MGLSGAIWGWFRLFLVKVPDSRPTYYLLPVLIGTDQPGWGPADPYLPRVLAFFDVKIGSLASL